MKKNNKGQALVEYVLIVSLIAIVTIGSIILLKESIVEVFAYIYSKFL